jgi:hypothetical protein
VVLATILYRAVLRRVRGTSHAHRLAQELFTTVWVPIVALVVLVVHQVNLRVPVHEVHEESSEILARGTGGGRRARHHWFELPALGGGAVPAARYASTGVLNTQYESGMSVVVRWRKGPLGSYVLLSAPIPSAPRAER